MSEQEPNTAEWMPPPPPEGPVPEPEMPEMSEVATLGNIFIEPGRTFEDLRRRPRFIIAAVLLMIMGTGFYFAFSSKMGEERFRRAAEEAFDKQTAGQNIPADARKQNIDIQVTIGQYVKYALPIIMGIIFVLGALLYWVGGKAMGSSISFGGALAVFIYSSFPTGVVATIANFIVLFLKSADDINIAESQRGLINANLGFLIDGKAMPVLATLVSVVDLFQIWGWILAAIGLRVVGKMSSGSAWGIVIIYALIGIIFRVIGAVMSGNPG